MYRYIAALALFFTELTLFKRLNIFEVRPELLLVATIFFGLRFGIARGVEIGILSGILKDVFTITGFGINTFPFLLIGFLSGCIKDKLVKENFISQFLVSGLAVYFISSAYFFVIPIGREFWDAVLWKALYTASLAPVLFLILSRVPIPRKT